MLRALFGYPWIDFSINYKIRSFTNHLIMACSANLLSYAFLVIFLVMLLKFSYRVLYLFDKLLCWILQATNTKSEYMLFHLSGEHFFMQTCKHASKLHTHHLLRVILQNRATYADPRFEDIWAYIKIFRWIREDANDNRDEPWPPFIPESEMIHELFGSLIVQPMEVRGPVVHELPKWSSFGKGTGSLRQL